MLKIVSNSVNTYIINTVKNRVVIPRTTPEEAKKIKSLISMHYWDTVVHDPNVEYELQYFSNHDSKISMMVKEFAFANVLYKGETIRTFMKGIYPYGDKDYKELAEQFKNDLEKYGIKLL